MQINHFLVSAIISSGGKINITVDIYSGTYDDYVLQTTVDQETAEIIMEVIQVEHTEDSGADMFETEE